ncbi:MAG: hypothetical protein GY814_16205, partial [Gammaproteobacteria bacterium]|nr:hypothetical protein [Gammaproteobacteria bacterium]
MDIKYIGNGGDWAEFSSWSEYFKALGTLTEDVICEFVDDREYIKPEGAHNDMDFSGVDFGPYQLIIHAADGVKHNGDFGNGARLVYYGTDWHGIYSPLGPDRDQFLIEDLSFEGRGFRGMGLGTSKGVHYNRVIVLCDPDPGRGASAFALLNSASTPPRLTSCRGHCTDVLATSGRGLLVQSYNTTPIDIDGLTISGFFNGVVLSGSQDSVGSINNVVATDCIDDCFAFQSAIGYSSASHNASDDGTHPGTDGVLITADPFEGDGYTPSQGGQLDVEGINTGAILGADGNPFALIRAIGAYPTYIPADSVAPILTNPTSEGHFQGLLCKVDTDEAYGVLFAV